MLGRVSGTVSKVYSNSQTRLQTDVCLPRYIVIYAVVVVWHPRNHMLAAAPVPAYHGIGLTRWSGPSRLLPFPVLLFSFAQAKPVSRDAAGFLMIRPPGPSAPGQTMLRSWKSPMSWLSAGRAQSQVKKMTPGPLLAVGSPLLHMISHRVGTYTETANLSF